MKTCNIKGMPMLTDLKGIRSRCDHVFGQRGVNGKTFVATDLDSSVYAPMQLLEAMNTQRDINPPPPLAWVDGWNEARKPCADVRNNPYAVGTDNHAEYAKGFDNYMQWLYSPED